MGEIGFTFGKELETTIRRKLIADVEAEVEQLNYYTRPDNTVVCQMFLKNGFVIEGKAVRYGYGTADHEAARKDAVSRLLDAKRYQTFQSIYEEQLRELNLSNTGKSED